MSDARCTALVDGSFRRGSDGRGYFLMAAVLVPDELQAAITTRLRAYVAPGQRRWHFRDERLASRRRFLAEVAQLHEHEVGAVVFCCPTPSQRKSEQARVRCLWNLVAELREREVQTAVFESRQEHNDRKDRREIMAAQRDGVASADLVYRHGRPKEEPLLWVADAIVGAVGLSVASHDQELAQLLPEPMQQVRWIVA